MNSLDHFESSACIKPVPFQSRLLSRCIATVVATASIAFVPLHVQAQQTINETNSPTTTPANKQTATENIEEVTVSGIRYSQRSALDRKKEAVTMTDSLVAEDIGAFPDKNIAEALQRIPGVQIARDNGEGATVSVRGVDPDLLRVELNNVGAMGMAGSRGVDFRDMASELVKSMDVIKGSEARLTEGGIGGTIQVNTRKPNEFEKDFFSASAETQYNDLIDEFMPKINLVGVHKFNEKLGVLVNLTGSDKSTVIHALRNTEWARFADYDNSPEKSTVNPKFENITTVAGCGSVAATDKAACEAQWQEFSPYLPRYGIWGRDEKRLTANTMIQYAFTDELSAYLGYTYNERDKTAHDINLQFETNSAARVDPASVVLDNRHNVIAFETRDASVSNRVLDFAWDQKTSMVESGFEYNLDKFQLTGVVARSTADQDIDSRAANAWAGGIVDMKVTLDDAGLPFIDLSNAYIRNASNPSDTSNKVDINNPASYSGGSSFNYRPSKDETKEDMAKLDFVYKPEAGFFTKFQTGYQYTGQSFANWNYRYDINRNVGTSYNGSVWTQANQTALLQGRTKETPVFFDHYNLDVDVLDTWQAVDPNAFIAELQRVSADNTTRSDLLVQRGNFDVDVETHAFYGQTNFETALGGFPLSGNIGVRVVDTKTIANGDVTIRVMVDQLDANGNPVRNPNTGAYAAPVENVNHPDTFNGRETIEEGYTEVLPSLNLSLQLIPDELELYFGAAEVMAHPRIADINVNATCTINDYIQAEIDNLANTCTAGNPALSPYRAKQMDLAINWYPNEDSIMSAALFAKELDTWTIEAERNEDIDFFNDGRLWDVTQKLDGVGAKIKGLELQAGTTFTMLPAPFDGFGTKVTYTYMEADDVGLFNSLTGEALPFPSQSENSYDITAFYETNVWGVRLAYNYRSEFLSLPKDRSGNPAFVEDAGYLDAKINYNITDNLKIYLDGRNLTGEVRAMNAGPGRMSTYDWAGREYALGITYKM